MSQVDENGPGPRAHEVVFDPADAVPIGPVALHSAVQQETQSVGVVERHALQDHFRDNRTIGGVVVGGGTSGVRTAGAGTARAGADPGGRRWKIRGVAALKGAESGTCDCGKQPGIGPGQEAGAWGQPAQERSAPVPLKSTGPRQPGERRPSAPPCPAPSGAGGRSRTGIKETVAPIPPVGGILLGEVIDGVVAQNMPQMPEVPVGNDVPVLVLVGPHQAHVAIRRQGGGNHPLDELLGDQDLAVPVVVGVIAPGDRCPIDQAKLAVLAEVAHGGRLEVVDAHGQSGQAGVVDRVQHGRSHHGDQQGHQGSHADGLDEIHAASSSGWITSRFHNPSIDAGFLVAVGPHLGGHGALGGGDRGLLGGVEAGAGPPNVVAHEEVHRLGDVGLGNRAGGVVHVGRPGHEQVVRRLKVQARLELRPGGAVLAGEEPATPDAFIIHEGRRQAVHGVVGGGGDVLQDLLDLQATILVVQPQDGPGEVPGREVGAGQGDMGVGRFDRKAPEVEGVVVEQHLHEERPQAEALDQDVRPVPAPAPAGGHGVIGGAPNGIEDDIRIGAGVGDDGRERVPHAGNDQHPGFIGDVRAAIDALNVGEAGTAVAANPQARVHQIKPGIAAGVGRHLRDRPAHLRRDIGKSGTAGRDATIVEDVVLEAQADLLQGDRFDVLGGLINAPEHRRHDRHDQNHDHGQHADHLDHGKGPAGRRRLVLRDSAAGAAGGRGRTDHRGCRLHKGGWLVADQVARVIAQPPRPGTAQFVGGDVGPGRAAREIIQRPLAKAPEEGEHGIDDPLLIRVAAGAPRRGGRGQELVHHGAKPAAATGPARGTGRQTLADISAPIPILEGVADVARDIFAGDQHVARVVEVQDGAVDEPHFHATLFLHPGQGVGHLNGEGRVIGEIDILQNHAAEQRA